ncbi:MAG: hotdog fold thioesterase [Actinomycetota bacterium]|jgi:uncharacterized protein (TIGR00369 family)
MAGQAENKAALVSDEGGVHELLGIKIIEASPERVVATMPVDERVHQPFGLLHGGISGVLAESAGSTGGFLSVGPGQAVVGTELSCSHLRSMTSGTLIATATPIRKGRSQQVWRIVLTDDQDRQICEARLSLAVIEIKERS